MMKVINKAKLPQALDLLSKDFRVLVPAKADAVTKFQPWEAGVELFLDENTLLPPKDALFPQTEKMYKYKVTGRRVEVLPEDEADQKLLLFAVRPCDVQSIKCMDYVFLTKGYEDNFYQRKRNGLVTVSLGCLKPAATCFCSSMGLDPARSADADIALFDLGDVFGLLPQTSAGEEVVAKLGGLLEEGQVQPPSGEDCRLKVDMAGVPEKLAKMFEHSLWEKISRKCLGCGACTYLCPTCHCFDISVKNAGDSGFRFRCWDSCMFSEYTRMAGGHNPRPSKKERVRNRFLHKLQYFKERYGELLCVGCGRCMKKCPVNMDITSIISQIREAEI